MSISIARISGINIPVNKKLYVSLSYLFGIGRQLGIKISNAVKINPNTKVKDLSEDDLAVVRKYIEENYMIEGDLRSQISQNIKLKISIGCYEGSRHRLKLPVRGQRTKTNAKTRKGKGKTVANKKIAAK